MNPRHDARSQRSRGETLDETIDRVAAQLTMVPADPALAGRIAERLEIGTFVLWPRLVVASAVVAAAVAILAVIVAKDGREVPVIDVAHVPPSNAPARIQTPPVQQPAMPTATVAADTTNQQRTVRQRRTRIADEPLAEMRQIDPLASPVLLAVGSLQSDELTITPVDLAPLGLANLSVADIDVRDSPKE